MSLPVLTFHRELRAAMKKRTQEIPCNTCKGKGTVGLDGPLASTLALFKRGRRLTAAEIQKNESDVNITAINNRLERLRGYGFLDRQKKGRHQLYFLPPKPR